MGKFQNSENDKEGLPSDFSVLAASVVNFSLNNYFLCLPMGGEEKFKVFLRYQNVNHECVSTCLLFSVCQKFKIDFK